MFSVHHFSHRVEQRSVTRQPGPESRWHIGFIHGVMIAPARTVAALVTKSRDRPREFVTKG
jgi:hypothetical protein